jgi:hypothetical protein
VGRQTVCSAELREFSIGVRGRHRELETLRAN